MGDVRKGIKKKQEIKYQKENRERKRKRKEKQEREGRGGGKRQANAVYCGNLLSRGTVELHWIWSYNNPERMVLEIAEIAEIEEKYSATRRDVATSAGSRASGKWAFFFLLEEHC